MFFAAAKPPPISINSGLKIFTRLAIPIDRYVLNRAKILHANQSPSSAALSIMIGLKFPPASCDKRWTFESG